MEQEKGRKNIIIYAVLFPLIAGLMLYLVFRSCDFRAVWKYAAAADIRFIIPAVIAMCGFVVCESVNIGRVLRASGYRLNACQLLTYGAAGFFFSGITPSSSGGQPMQLVYMAYDHIRLSHGSLSLLLELMGFQVINIGLAVFGIIYNFDYINAMSRGIRIGITLGILANVAVFVTLLFLIFNDRVSGAIGRFLKYLIKVFRRRDTAGEGVDRQLSEYRTGAVYIREHPALIIKNILTSMVQLTALYSISYFVYCALGGSEYGWVNVFSLQAVLSAAIAVIPLPGSVGAGESGFRLMFAQVFTGELLMPGMLLSRGISFYLGMLITGVFLLIVFIKRKAGVKKQ